MKILMFGIALFLATGTPGQSARNYYDELYKAAGLDRMADQYVCFDDDPALETFFIFAKSDTLKQFLSDNGGYEKLPAKSKEALQKGFLTVRQYDKGVPLSIESSYTKDEGSSWLGEIAYLPQGKTPVRMRFELSWQTLRYKRSLEFLNANHTMKSQVSRYGRCEEISPAVQQKGD
jgi:hypothetical protein